MFIKMRIFIKLFSLLLIASTVLSACSGKSEDTVYSIGVEIAEGISTSLAVGFTSIDPNLEYEIQTSNDEFTSGEYTWPIIDVTINTKSEVLNSPKITFVLLLEMDENYGTVVATLKNIKVDGKVDPSLEIMNNTMYVETDEGTEQVQLIDGELYFVE
jgi:hypothetical protein